MGDEYKEKFTVRTDGMHKLIYEDLSCRIELPAADVRDISIWVLIGRTISRNGSNISRLTEKQRLHVYKRVSAIMKLEGHDGIFTDEFEFIKEDINNIDYSKNILDIEG